MGSTKHDGWGEVALADGATVTRRLGPLTILLRRAHEEVWVAHHRTSEADLPDDGDDPDGAEPDEPSWTRWSHRSAKASIRLVPVFPDRLVVVSPEVPFHLAPGVDARIYVRIPLWVRIVSKDGAENVLIETPIVELSDTWWGDHAAGELGYWLNTAARRQLSDELFVDYLAVCPLNVRNRSNQVLAVEKFALRVAHLSLYRNGRGLWGAETQVVYENDEEGSRIEITRDAPPEAKKAELMSPPREPRARGFRALTFGRFKPSSGS